MIDDKTIEQNRYNRKSESELIRLSEIVSQNGAESMVEYLRTPYFNYEKLIKNEVQPHFKILDMCCGNGVHSLIIPSMGIPIICTDIAEKSLIVAKERATANKLGSLLTFIQADAASQPFEDNSFDLITCAGSLSYFDKQEIVSEVLRLLKPGGKFIAVDSFNHNPIYRLNRYIHYLRGKRTWSTLQNMPSMETISFLKTKFENVSVEYFGIFSFLAKPIALIFGVKNAKKVIDYLDSKLYLLRKYSFKITIFAAK